jgi:hypothetical protein
MTPPFYFDQDHPGCPALTASCRRPAHLVAGDVVLTGETRGGFVRTTFASTRGQLTEGWVERRALVAIKPTMPSLAAWAGHWRRDDEADLDMKTGRAGAVAFSGDAVWGSHDPERVKSGGVHVGDLDGHAIPAGNRLGPVDGDGSGGTCMVAMRLAGPYLIVTDNLGCGGMNVSFAGVYRRTGPARPAAR